MHNGKLVDLLQRPCKQTEESKQGETTSSDIVCMAASSMQTCDLDLVVKVVSEHGDAELSRTVRKILLDALSVEHVVTAVRILREQCGDMFIENARSNRFSIGFNAHVEHLATSLRLQRMTTSPLIAFVVRDLHETRCWQEKRAIVITNLIDVSIGPHERSEEESMKEEEEEEQDVDLIGQIKSYDDTRVKRMRVVADNDGKENKRAKWEWIYSFDLIELLIACRPDLLSPIIRVVLDADADEHQKRHFIELVNTYPRDWLASLILREMKGDENADWVQLMVREVKAALEHGSTPLAVLNFAHMLAQLGYCINDDEEVSVDSKSFELSIARLPDMTIEEIVKILDKKEMINSAVMSGEELRCTIHLLNEMGTINDISMVKSLVLNHRRVYWRFWDSIISGHYIRCGPFSREEHCQIEKSIAFILRFARQHPDSSILPNGQQHTTASLQPLPKTIERSIVRLIMTSPRKQWLLPDLLAISNIHTGRIVKLEVANLLERLLGSIFQIHDEENDHYTEMTNLGELSGPKVDVIIDLLILFQYVLMTALGEEKRDAYHLDSFDILNIQGNQQVHPDSIQSFALFRLCKLSMQKVKSLLQSHNAEYDAVAGFALFSLYHCLFDQAMFSRHESAVSVFLQQLFQDHVSLLHQSISGDVTLDCQLRESVLNTALLVVVQCLRLACNSTKPYSLENTLQRSNITIDWNNDVIEEASALVENLNSDYQQVPLYRLLSFLMPRNLFHVAFKSRRSQTDFHRTVIDVCTRLPTLTRLRIFPALQACIVSCFRVSGLDNLFMTHSSTGPTSDRDSLFCNRFSATRKQFILQTMGDYVDRYAEYVTHELEIAPESRKALRAYAAELIHQLEDGSTLKQIKVSLLHAIGVLAYVKPGIKCIVKHHPSLFRTLLSNIIPPRDSNVMTNSALALNLIVTNGLSMPTLDQSYQSTLHDICKTQKVIQILCQHGLDLITMKDIALAQTNLETIYRLLTSFRDGDATHIIRKTLKQHDLSKKLFSLVNISGCLDSLHTEESADLLKIAMQTMSFLVNSRALSDVATLQEPACALLCLLSTDPRTQRFNIAHVDSLYELLAAVCRHIGGAVRTLQESGVFRTLHQLLQNVPNPTDANVQALMKLIANVMR